MKEIQLVIPMAGSSQMFMDAGYESPKWLIDIEGKPMVQHVIDQFPGVTDILLVCKEDEVTEDTLLKLRGLGGEVVTVRESLGGPIDTLLQVANHIADDKEVVVSYCDHGMVWDFPSFINQARERAFDGSMACYRNFHPHMLGTENLYTFCLNNSDSLTSVEDKKKFTEDRKNQFVSSDVFYFRTGEILKTYLNKANKNPSMNGFIALVYNLLLKDGLSVGIHEIERMLLWATPEDLDTYTRWSNYFNKKSHVSKKPQDFTVVIPMCGLGTRFKKEGYKLPKPLLPVGGIPMFASVVQCLPKHKNNIFVCSTDPEVESSIKSQYPNSKIKSIDFVTEGFAESCELGIGMMNEEDPILISPCDNGADYDEKKFLDLVSDNENDVIIWTTTGSQAPKVNPAMYTWVHTDSSGDIVDMTYKKIPETSIANTPVSVGVMYFRKAKYLIEGLNKNRQSNFRPTGELCMDSVAHTLADMGYKVKVFDIDHYACWGTPSDYKTDGFWREHFKGES